MKILNKVNVYTERIRKAYKYAKESRLFSDPIDTPLGFKFIGNKEMEQGVFEPDETKLVTTLLKKTDIFINIGANIGYYSCIALKNGINTIIFEPIQSNLVLLYKNIYSNKFTGEYEIYPIALSSKSGLIEIFGSGTGASLIKGWANTPDYHVSLVPVSTLDTVIGSRFNKQQCFVLIDVEGVEKMVLEGANVLLHADIKPVWMLEIVTTEHQPLGVTVNPNLLSTFQMFWDSGYEAWTASNEIRLIEQAEVEKIFKGAQSTFSGNINFLFIDKGKKDYFI